MFRTVGIALVPAMVVHLWLQRPERRRRGWIPPAVWVVAFFVVYTSLPTITSYADQLGRDATAFVRNAVAAVYRYRLSFADLVHYPFPWHLANDAYHLVAVVLAGMGFAAWARRSKRDLALVWLPFYAILLLSFTTQAARYIWPLYPLLAACTLWGAHRLALRLARSSTYVAGAAVIASSVLIVTPDVLRLTTAPPVEDFADSPAVKGVFAYVARQAGAGPVRVTFFNPRVLTWRTHVPAMGTFVASPEETLRELCAQGITHVVLGDPRDRPELDASFRSAVATYPDFFPPVYGNDLYEIRRFSREKACEGGQ
jgi:hypothetical protein